MKVLKETKHRVFKLFFSARAEWKKASLRLEKYVH
jgi:hypothetical protein